MRGEILSFDGATGTGQISGDDGLRYEFTVTEIQSGTASQAQRVDFVAVSGQATQIMILAATPQPAAAIPGGTYSGEASAADTINWQHLMLKFDGRIRRTHFGIAWLVLFGANIILSLIPFIGGLLSLLLLWPGFAIAVKRLHDMGHTGWIAAAPYVLGLIGTIAAVSMIGLGAIMNMQQLQNEDPAAILALIGPALAIFALIGLIGIGFLLWILLTPGQPRTNRFGPNPKGQ